MYTLQQTIARSTLRRPKCTHHTKQSLVEHSKTPHVHTAASNHSYNTQTPHMYTPHQAITRTTLRHPTCTHHRKQSLVQHWDTPHVHTTPSNNSQINHTPHMYTPHQSFTRRTLKDPTYTHHTKQSLAHYLDNPYVHTTPSNHSYNTQTPHMYTPHQAITRTTLKNPKYTPHQAITRTTLRHPTCTHHRKQSLAQHSDTCDSCKTFRPCHTDCNEVWWFHFDPIRDTLLTNNVQSVNRNPKCYFFKVSFYVPVHYLIKIIVSGACGSSRSSPWVLLSAVRVFFLVPVFAPDLQNVLSCCCCFGCCSYLLLGKER